MIRTRAEYEAGLAHLAACDDRMAHIIANCTKTMFDFDSPVAQVEPFEALSRSIIYQQLSGKAASTILGRFLGLFDIATDPSSPGAVPRQTTASAPTFPTPQQVLAQTMEQLRSVGLSGRKAEYLLGLAELCKDGTITRDKIMGLSDADLSKLLCSVRGIGQWTVDMFMMFRLRRPNVLPVGDLGVRRGMTIHFTKTGAVAAKKKNELISIDDMIRLAEPWVPYRTLGSFMMWQFQDMQIPEPSN
ncbi:hypothetical protein HK105_206282 [Polyrhizophydium stewartii]|uniref:HhH-GPD domain-containing protein n=1 Tax=Polyrhizophydium stewartii TaxID=2732419 RepID=A0ABR4N3X5_9FUNG